MGGRALSPAGDRQSCGQMVSGLLMELEDHNCWTIAEAAGHRGPHAAAALAVACGLGRPAGCGRRGGVGGRSP